MSDRIQDVANVLGNATETALTTAIVASPLGELPFVGPQLEKIAIGAAKDVSNKVNQGISGVKNIGKGKGGGGGRGNPPGGPAPFGTMEPPMNPSGGSGAAARSRSYDGNGYYTQERLATNPEPYQFTLNTGIRTPAYSPLYQNSVLNGNISMRLASYSINYQIDSFAVSQFFQTVISQVFANSIQRAVSFNAGTTITATSLANYMNAIINGLNAYFYAKSILAYTFSPLNRNDAMVSLRNGIVPSDFTGLYNLERVLLQSPLPPNLVNLCWWLNGIYTDGNLPNATLNKMITITTSSYSSSTGAYAHNINWQTLINAIQSQQSVANLVSRAVPKWLYNNLPAYPTSPVYDANWLTVFANVPVHVKDSVNTSTVRAPYLSTPTDSWSYNTYTNELDGAALALCTAWDNTNGRFLPNLGNASNVIADSSTAAGNFTNRLVWINGVWSNSNLATTNTPFLTSLYTYTVGRTANTFMVQYPSATQVILGVDTSAVNQASIQLAEWLFNIDSIGYIEDKRIYDGDSPSSRIGLSRNQRRRRK